jgi:hypothetical protein
VLDPVRCKAPHKSVTRDVNRPGESGESNKPGKVRPVLGAPCRRRADYGAGPTGMRWPPRWTVRRWSRRCARWTAVTTRCVRVSRPGGTGLLHVVGGCRDNMEMMASGASSTMAA